jgi:hypothetical protein
MEFLAAFELGQAPESLDYRPYLSRSTDGGQTWTAPTQLVPDPPKPIASTLGRIARLHDGTIVGFGAFLIRDNPNEGILNHTNFGYVPTKLFTIRSTDGGHKWSLPELFEPPIVGPSFEICHPIMELPDGRWLAPVGTWKDWNGNAPNGMKAIALVSTDRGRTWPSYIDVMDGYARGVIHFEQSITRLPDGRLLAVAWAYNEKTGKSEPTPYAISSDGRTFAAPRPTGLRGQTMKLVTLPDGRVLGLYRRDDKPGLWANVSRIDGDAWVNLDEAPVWQGVRHSGMAGERSAGDELSDLKFGSPNLRLLPSGDVLAAFWCYEQEQYIIRWIRVSIP